MGKTNISNDRLPRQPIIQKEKLLHDQRLNGDYDTTYVEESKEVGGVVEVDCGE